MTGASTTFGDEPSKLKKGRRVSPAYASLRGGGLAAYGLLKKRRGFVAAPAFMASKGDFFL
ncbi:hypothetical protein ABEV73_14735, partial [Geobacillus stearothermophilus]|uniref:hypothetical protein n=1 Tax=Geobacillus stearothermophilus TaxID=1422 RepID=UPI003D1A66D4